MVWFYLLIPIHFKDVTCVVRITVWYSLIQNMGIVLNLNKQTLLYVLTKVHAF